MPTGKRRTENDRDINSIGLSCRKVVTEYGRAIVHMRQQKARGKFGLVFGAGASTPLGFPNWKKLLTRIAEHPEVCGADLVKKADSYTSLSQLLFQRYRKQRGDVDTINALNRDGTATRAKWHRLVHECLYRDVPSSVKELKDRDEYLWAYIDLIKKTPLTVNYNFDNTLQRLLADARTSKERARHRGYATVWSSNIQLNSRLGVIYHPNGFLPSSLRERPSEQLVFLDDSFADQLIDTMAGHYSALSNHLAQNTCLLVGLSLSDANLRHLLRQNARTFPGHYHYYIAHVSDKRSSDQKYKAAVSAANFSVYNLVTLFLTSREIASLGKILAMGKREFAPLAEELGQPTVYRFFLTGCVSVGKSTTVSHFRSLATYDEWIEERAPGMEKAFELLTKSQRAKIDAWVDDQIGKKNVVLCGANSGIHVMDRAPLDAFAFVPRNEWPRKAKRIRQAVSPGQAKRRRLAPGRVILLTGTPEVMEVRALARHKQTNAASLRKQQTALREIYAQHEGVAVVDTRDKSIFQVVKEVAEIIHVHPYIASELDDWLTDLYDGRISSTVWVDDSAKALKKG